jgi:hypothetical protein
MKFPRLMKILVDVKNSSRKLLRKISAENFGGKLLQKTLAENFGASQI